MQVAEEPHQVLKAQTLLIVLLYRLLPFNLQWWAM